MQNASYIIILRLCWSPRRIVGLTSSTPFAKCGAIVAGAGGTSALERRGARRMSARAWRLSLACKTPREVYFSGRPRMLDPRHGSLALILSSCLSLSLYLGVSLPRRRRSSSQDKWHEMSHSSLHQIPRPPRREERAHGRRDRARLG